MLESGLVPTTTPLWFSSGVVVVWLGVVLSSAEALYRYRHLNPEFSRKIVHIGTGNVILIAWGLGVPAWIGIAAAIVAGFAPYSPTGFLCFQGLTVLVARVWEPSFTLSVLGF